MYTMLSADTDGYQQLAELSTNLDPSQDHGGHRFAEVAFDTVRLQAGWTLVDGDADLIGGQIFLNVVDDSLAVGVDQVLAEVRKRLRHVVADSLQEFLEADFRLLVLRSRLWMDNEISLECIPPLETSA